MPTNLMPSDAIAKEQPAAQAPDFKTFADQYLNTALGKPVSWESLDAEIAKLPADPTTGKPTTDAAKVRKNVVDSYVNDVLPQHYPREVLPQMQAKARADLDAQVTASSIGSAESGKADPKTAGYDSLIKLEGTLKDPAQRAENTIALDKAARANGKKLISDLGLSQVDVGARRTLIQQEIDKRRKLAELVVAKFNAGEVPAEQAQGDIDRIAREVSSLDGALKDTNDASTWSTEAVWAAGGVSKALISIPEFAGRIINGTTNWITDKPFAVGFADESGAVVGSMASARQWITHSVEDWDIGDPSQVKLDATMQAFDDGGFGGGLTVAANHPEVALRMLATSGVDSVAQFLAGSYAGAGTAALVKGAMRGAASVAELTTLAQGAATARMIGGVSAGTSSAALGDADEEKRHLTDALNSMGTDKFLSMPEIQKEQAVWGKLQGEALNTYVASKKQAIIDDAYTKTATTTAALLAASGYVGSKYGVEAWLLGRTDALGAAAGASVGKRVAHGALSGVVGGAHQGLEEVAETGTQHVFYVDALNKDMHDKTPFSNFSGAFTQGFVVGGVMDGYAGSRAQKTTATPDNPTTPDDLTTQWNDEQLQTPEVAKRVDAAYAVFGSEASPYSVSGLKNTMRESSDGTSAPAFFTLDKGTRERLDRLQQQAGDPTQPTTDLQQSRARHMLMLETARVKRTLETRDRREAYRSAMDATRTPKDDPNEFIRSGMAQEHNQMNLLGVPERNEMVQARADSQRVAPVDELRVTDPAQGELDFAPQGMNYDWLVHGANNPQSQATGTVDDQLALPLDATFSGEDPLSRPSQMGLPLGLPYDPSLTPKPYTQEDYGIGTGWQMQLAFDSTVPNRVLEIVDNLQAQQAQQEPQVVAQTTQPSEEPVELPPDSNTALAIEAGIPVAEHHTSIANQVIGTSGVDVTVDDKGKFHVVLSNNTEEDTRITPISIADAVENAKTMLPNSNPFEQANVAIQGIMTAVSQVGKVKNPAVVSAVRYAVLRDLLNALPNNYVTHHPSGRRRSEKQMRKSATTWAGLHRTMIEERARIYDAPRSTTAYDYVVGNRTTLTPRLKPHREALDDLRGKWFIQQNELEALGTDGIVDALVTAPEKTAATAAKEHSTNVVDPVQAATDKVASVEVAQTISDLDAGELMSPEVAAEVATTNDVRDQAQEQLQADLADALAAVDTSGSPEQVHATLQTVEASAEAQAEVLGVPLDTTQLDIAYEQIARDATPEPSPEALPVTAVVPPHVSNPKPRKRRKAAFEPPPEAEYITPPVEDDPLVATSYLNDDKKLDAAIRVSEMKARKQKKVPLWQQRRDAELGLTPPVEVSQPEAQPVDNVPDVTSVAADIIPELVEQVQTQHETLSPSVKRKGKRKVDAASIPPTVYVSPDDVIEPPNIANNSAELPIKPVAKNLADNLTPEITAQTSPATSTNQPLDFSNGWLNAVLPHLNPSQQDLAKAADAIVQQRGGDNNVYVSFDKGVMDDAGGFYVNAWDKAFMRYSNMVEPKLAATTVLHEKLHQALRDADSIETLKPTNPERISKLSPQRKELLDVLANMEGLLAHTRRVVADRAGKEVAYEGVLYGLKNTAEFRAELSNPAFGRLLAAIETPSDGTVLGAVLRAVRKLFGLYVPSVRDVALNDLHRLLQMTAGGSHSKAAQVLARRQLLEGTKSAEYLHSIERSGYVKLTPANPAALYTAAQRDGYGSPAMQLYANRQVADAPLSADTLKAQFDKMDGC